MIESFKYEEKNIVKDKDLTPDFHSLTPDFHSGPETYDPGPRARDFAPAVLCALGGLA